MKLSQVKAWAIAATSVFGVLTASGALAATEGMPSMPVIHPKQTFTIQTVDQGEALQEERGFGDQEKTVAMMNLMMVEGSGFEGMDMSGMEMSPAPQQVASAPAKKETAASAPAQVTPVYDVKATVEPSAPQVGANHITLVVIDKNHKPVTGLALTSEVYMTNMDMGTDEPKVKEVGNGKYKVKAVFSMKGPWAVKIKFPGGQEKVFDYDVRK